MISGEGYAATRFVLASGPLRRGPTWAETDRIPIRHTFVEGSVLGAHLSPCRQTGRDPVKGYLAIGKNPPIFFRSTQGVQPPQSNAISFRPATDDLARSEPENRFPFQPESAVFWQAVRWTT